jgi:two-component system KDP operon response regulator KdpE
MTPTPPGARILVVDDEPQIHRFLGPALEAAGYEVERADSAAEGLRLAASRAPDLVLLDLGLPDMDGQEALARLRGFSPVPVIVLSARDREADKIAALDRGADDYVEKPFAVGELMARIRTALRHRRTQDGVAEILRFEGLEIDFSRRLAHLEGTPLVLSRREWALLSLLARNSGRVLTHRQLLTAVWGPAHADDVQYLRVYVGQIRQKLGAASRLITTEPGVGYRMAEEGGMDPAVPP